MGEWLQAGKQVRCCANSNYGLALSRKIYEEAQVLVHRAEMLRAQSTIAEKVDTAKVRV